MACDDDRWGGAKGRAAERCFRGILAPPFCHRRRRSLIRRSRPPQRVFSKRFTYVNVPTGRERMCPLPFFLFTLFSFSISKGVVTQSPQPRNVPGDLSRPLMAVIYTCIAIPAVVFVRTQHTRVPDTCSVLRIRNSNRTNGP